MVAGQGIIPCTLDREEVREKNRLSTRGIGLSRNAGNKIYTKNNRSGGFVWFWRSQNPGVIFAGKHKCRQYTKNAVHFWCTRVRGIKISVSAGIEV